MSLDTLKERKELEENGKVEKEGGVLTRSGR